MYYCNIHALSFNDCCCFLYAVRHHVRKYIQGIGLPQKDFACGNGISLFQLMSIANSVAGVKIFPVKDSHTKSFAYLPAFKKKNCLKAKVFESGGGKCGQVKHACERNFKDAEMKLINDCPVVTNYWSTWTPCVFCQWSLMKWKALKQNKKVTIWIGAVYTDTSSGKFDTKKSTIPDCLSRMYRKGFDLKVWSWGQFLTDAGLWGDCLNVVNLLYKCTEIENAERRIKSVLDNAYNRSTQQINLQCFPPVSFSKQHMVKKPYYPLNTVED